MSFLLVSLRKHEIPHRQHARNKVNTRDWNHDVQRYLTIKTSFTSSYRTNSYWENKDGNVRPAEKKKEREREKEDIIRDCKDSILIYLDRKVQRVCSLVRSTLTLTWLSGLFWVNRLTPFSYQDSEETHATDMFSMNLVLLGCLPLTFFTSFITHHSHSTSIFAAIHGHHCGQERPVVVLWICAKMLELQHGRHFRTTIWTESSLPTG